MLNPEIFRQYDIRGIAGKDMRDEDVVLLGQGIGTYLARQGNRFIAVGYDCRVTSAAYARALITGLLATGARIVDVGMVPTPLTYYAIRYLNTQGSVMVTASHNPPQYNGFKICSGTDSVYGEQIQEIRRIIDIGRFEQGAGRFDHCVSASMPETAPPG
jgi:phosphomannomutase/phosphoglucomutase